MDETRYVDPNEEKSFGVTPEKNKETVYTAFEWADEIVEQKTHAITRKIPILHDLDGIKASDRNEALAKEVQTPNNTRYLVKMSLSGLFFNPSELYVLEKRKFGVSKGWHFKQVSKIAFQYYLNFLATKNQAWLLKAQREGRK